VQDHAADELDVEVAHAERAFGGLADDREDLLEMLVEHSLDVLAAFDVLARQLALWAS